jgi:hypothetical protein
MINHLSKIVRFVAALYVINGCGNISSGLDPVSPFSISPTNGAIGTLISLSGMDFSTVQTLTVGGVSAILLSQSSTSLVGFVMPGSTSGDVSVTTSTGQISTSLSTFTVTAAGVPNNQQGSKLVGSGTVGNTNQGYAVSISADGNTALVGGTNDSTNTGAAWVFTRSGGVWTQQGSKLVGTGAVGAAQQGASVALSADGNTALFSGYKDNTNTGAVWVFTRTGGVWTQQGSKLVGSGAVGAAQQGWNVALSADGNTAVIGGWQDNTNTGAVWVFTRSGGVWTQQGSKLTGSGAVGAARQGYFTAISADGNTLAEGAYGDNGNTGAVWIFTRSGSTWTQQGSKLVGTGAVGAAEQGTSVAISADGNTVLSGGYSDNSGVGAMWVFTRNGTTWTQQGAKLVGTGNIGTSYQGNIVALSADGGTAISGGFGDDSSTGAAWIFTRSNNTWTQAGSKVVGTGTVGAAAQAICVALSADGSTLLSGGNGDNSGMGATWVFTP